MRASATNSDFSSRYALVVFESRALYTFIPKNACSTLRFSLAVANGFLEPGSDPNWIHQNINSGSTLFRASDNNRDNAPYSFVVLRDPFRRLASAYLDQILSGKYPALQLAHQIDPRLNTVDECASLVLGWTFSTFVDAVCNRPRETLNEHFRPQVDFFALDDYSRWFSVERFADAVTALRDDIGFTVYDTRGALTHDASSKSKVDDPHTHTPVAELSVLKAKGSVPSLTALYDEHTIRRVADYFADDIALYRDKFGPEDLVVNPETLEMRR